MIELAREFWLFLKVRKKWWLAPIVLVLGLMGRDPLDRRLGDRASYWVERRRHANPEGSMEHRF